MVTLDGFFEGPNGEIDWHNADEEFNEFAVDQVKSADGLIFGRVTYELMASYWPTPAAQADDPMVAEKMNTMPKIVFSRTLDKVEWNNTRLVKGDAVKEISQLKQEPGKDLLIFGSADLASSLTKHSLIDEYRIMVNPVVLSKGKPLFKDVKEKLNLRLLKTKTFGNGNVLLYYEPIK
jgi:dihydrofolate reductase